MIVEGTNSGASDGRGGKEPIPGMKADHRYIYYRFYTKEGALESHNPIYSDDRFISRILSRSVAPPRTAGSLKTYLCWVEGFEMPKTCDLYISLSEKAAVEDSTRIQLRGKDPGPGSSKFQPIALVIDVSAAAKRTAAASTEDLKELPKWQDEQRYIYYRVYTEKGEIASKTSFDETDVSLGRINALSIAPPHMGASLKSWLVKAEGVADRDTQLFEDDDGDSILKDSDSIALFSDACPGIIEDAPMAFVQGPLKILSDTQPQDPASGFSKQLKAGYTTDWAQGDSAWHSITAGEIFKTDGVLRNVFNKPNGRTIPCYEAINSSGKGAFIAQCNSILC